MTAPVRAESESLAALLGGRRGAVDASLPPLVFALGWLSSGRSVAWGVGLAAASALLLAAWRRRRGDRPRSVLLGLLAVCAAGLVALYTGRAEDFFLIQLLSNGASALVWSCSIVLRRPLLGVIVGSVLRQRGAWRADPALLRGYSRASWVWVGQYGLRLAVFLPLWSAGWVGALAVARVALTWPLVAACLAISWQVLRRSLPQDHPGLRRPRGTADAAAEGRTAKSVRTRR